jgi:integrase
MAPGPAAVVPLHGRGPAPGQTIAGAVDGFLSQADLLDSTRREYRKHLGRLAGRLGADRPLATVTAGELEATVTALWGGCKPRTWNQRLAVVGSFLAFARRRGWAADDLALGLERRRVKVDRTRVPTPAELERFWAKQNVPLVVKVFTRLQYETAARATELLSADVGDLDMGNRRLRVTSKGGDVEWVYFQSGSARNLPRLLRGARQRAAVRHPPAARPGARARRRRRLPGHRAGQGQLPAHGRAGRPARRLADPHLPQGAAFPPRRQGLRRRRVADQVPPQEPPLAGALRPRPRRAGGQDHRRDRPKPPAALTGGGG